MIVTFSVILFVLFSPILSSSFITICVRPNTLNYEGVLMCKRNNIIDALYLKTAKIYDREAGIYSCISLWVSFQSCDQNETNAMVKITKTGTNETQVFEMPKTHLYFSDLPIVLPFGNQTTLTNKTFYFKNPFEFFSNINESLGIEIGCKIGLDDNKYYTIGSAIYQDETSGLFFSFYITAELYDIESAEHLCGRDREDINNKIEIHLIQKNTLLLN